MAYPGTPRRRERGAQVAVEADRRAEAVGGGGGARRPERPAAGALRDAGALLGARQAEPPRRPGRLLKRRQPGGRARPPLQQQPVPLQARGASAAPGDAPPARGRRQAPGSWTFSSFDSSIFSAALSCRRS
jgi:hypothetical protein